MKSPDVLSKLILKIHEAAQEPSEWERILTKVSDLGSGEALSIGSAQTGTFAPKVITSIRYPKEFNERIDDLENPSNEIGMQKMMYMKEGQILVPTQIFRSGEFEASNIHRDIMDRYKLYPFYIRRLFTEGSQTFFYMANKEVKDCDLPSDHGSFVKIITDHVLLSLKTELLIEQAQNERDDFISALEYSSYGIITIDETRRILFANRLAERILKQSDGLSIHRGRLEAISRDDTSRLEKLIREASSLANGHIALDQRGGSLLVQRQSPARPFSVFVAPLIERTEFSLGQQTPRAAIFVSDPDVTLPVSNVHRLQGLFGLTTTEARVALELLSGQGIRHVSELMEVSMATVKTHQRAIFQKLDVKTQAELARFLLSSAALINT